jgi:transcriptional regulator with XRE-family HTH domain
VLLAHDALVSGVPVPQKEFGTVIAKARGRKGWSQSRLAKEVAAALNGAGGAAAGDAKSLTQSTISQWEQGRTLPRRENLYVLEDVLGFGEGELVVLLDDLLRAQSGLQEARRRGGVAPAGDPTIAALRTDPDLSDEDKAAAIRYIKLLKGQ